MKKLSLFICLVASVILGNAGQSYGIDYSYTFYDLTPKLIAGDVFGAGLNNPYTFEITNDTGQTWTDFHMQVALGPAGTQGTAWIDSYTGLGTTAFSRINAPSPYFDVLDVTGLNIPDAEKLAFTLNISAGESGWILGGNPTVGGDNVVNPVPEPASMMLLGFGLLGAVGFRRRTKK